MKFRTITVFTNHQDADLVASAMFDVGAGGVSVLDRQDFLDLVKSDVIWDYVDESVLSAGDEVKVSTVTEVDDKEFAGRLSDRLAQMRESGGISYGEIIEDYIDAADYENEWKKYYKPIPTANITVVPTWIKYQPEEGERVMRLDPGMAFGTGSHATTRMCLDMLDVKDKDVIDVGCGSGILGIAAKLCGAKSVYMCDIDEQAVKFARQNAQLNGVEAEIECADLIKGTRTADVIIANITADILMRLSKDLGKHLREGGHVVLSGIIDSRLEEVLNCYRNEGYEVVQSVACDDWRALKIIKRQI